MATAPRISTSRMRMRFTKFSLARRRPPERVAPCSCCAASVGWLSRPLAEAAHRHGVAGVDRASGAQGLEDRLDETVARVAGEAFAVGAEIGQLTLLVQDRHRRAGRYAGAAGERGEGLHGAQGGR